MSLIPSFGVLDYIKYGAIAIALAAILGFTVHTSYTYGFNEAQVAAQAAKLKQDKANEQAITDALAQKKAVQDKLDGLADELQQTQAKLKEAQGNTHVQVVKEIHSNTVYQSCIVPASGVQLISDQARQLNAIRHSK